MPTQSIGTDQPYLVLVTLAADQTLTANETVADLVAELRASLDQANALWKENSYGKVSFGFDIHAQLVNVDQTFEHYYRLASGSRVMGDASVFPVTWQGGETLSITYDTDPPVEVVFPAGEQDMHAIRTAINTEITAAYGSPLPFIATLTTRGTTLSFAIMVNQAGPDHTLEIAETDGALALGLAPSQSTPKLGTHTFYNHESLAEDAVARWEALSASNDISAYRGLIIAPPRGSIRAFASEISIDRDDGEHRLSIIVIPPTHEWDVFAHELGHNLGLPDLYDEKTDGIDQPGLEVGTWDIMSSNGARHTTAWCKHWRPRDRDGDGEASGEAWMTDVPAFEPPPPDKAAAVDYLVYPTELGFPTTNPFADDYPNTKLCHAVRIPIGPGRAVYIENRQQGPFSDPELGRAEFDQGLPSAAAIICTDALDSWSDPIVLPVFRRHVALVDDHAPLEHEGDSLVVAAFGKQREVTVTIKKVLGDVAKVYLVEVRWAGPGDNRECEIRAWDPSPWESPDIWVDTEVDNDWDEYRQSDREQNPDVPGHPVGNGDRLRVGWPARVYARFHNHGSLPANNVEVEFEVVIPAGIGPVDGYRIGKHTIDIPAGGSALARVDWVPRADNHQHVCIIARATNLGDDGNPYDNEAQENLTEWWMEGESPYVPVRIEYRMTNPVPQRAQIRMRAKGLPRGWKAVFSQDRYSLGVGENAEGDALIGANYLEVPFEDILRKRGEQAPLISLEAEVLYGCQWIPFGGVSAVVHPVRKAQIVIQRPPADTKFDLVGGVRTAQGPVGKGQITARLTYRGKQLWLARTSTDRTGQFGFSVPRPKHLPKGATAQIELHLSPRLGLGPCHHPPIDVTFAGTTPSLFMPKPGAKPGAKLHTAIGAKLERSATLEPLVRKLELSLGSKLTRP